MIVCSMRIFLVFILFLFLGQQTTVNGQQTSCTVPEPVEGTTLGASTSSATAYPRTVDCCPLSVDFICAKAHYYHAVGLTEKDDIVGACEHYLIALEIMEEDDLIKSLRDAKTQRRKVLKKQRNDEKTLCDSVTLRLCVSATLRLITNPKFV